MLVQKTVDCRTVNNRMSYTVMDNMESLIYIPYRFLDYGRTPAHLEKTQSWQENKKLRTKHELRKCVQIFNQHCRVTCPCELWLPTSKSMGPNLLHKVQMTEQNIGIKNYKEVYLALLLTWKDKIHKTCLFLLLYTDNYLMYCK